MIEVITLVALYLFLCDMDRWMHITARDERGWRGVSLVTYRLLQLVTNGAVAYLAIKLA